jgi:hypothetical protein
MSFFLLFYPLTHFNRVTTEIQEPIQIRAANPPYASAPVCTHRLIPATWAGVRRRSKLAKTNSAMPIPEYSTHRQRTRWTQIPSLAHPPMQRQHKSTSQPTCRAGNSETLPRSAYDVNPAPQQIDKIGVGRERQTDDGEFRQHHRP